MSLIRNERTKLLATAVNNLAVATLVTGFVAPAIGVVSRPGASSGGWLIVAIVCILVSIGLHAVAQSILGRLRA